jgi:hypothetical protein
MGWVGPLLAAGGTAMQAYGAYSAGRAQELSDRSSADLMKQNARAVRLKARYDQLRQLVKGREIVGRMRSGYGKAGIVLSEGAPFQVLANQMLENAYENALIGTEGLNRANQYLYQASVYRARGKNAASAGRTKVYATLLSGFTKMYDQGMLGGSKAGGGGTDMVPNSYPGSTAPLRINP